jgi:hypothetical protein
MDVNIREIELKLDRLAFQQQPDPHTIAAEQRELEILKQKMSALPQDDPTGVYA